MLCVINVHGFLCVCIDFQSIAPIAIALMAVMAMKMATLDDDKKCDSTITKTYMNRRARTHNSIHIHIHL